MTSWTVACQAPLSMGFSRQEYLSGLSFPSLGNLLNPGIEPTFLMFPTLAARFFTTGATWETWEHAWEYGFWKFLGEGEPQWVLYHTHSSSHYGQSWDLLYSRNLGSQLKGITFLSCIFRFNIWQVPKEINKHSLQFGTERTLFSLLFLVVWGRDLAVTSENISQLMMGLLLGSKGFFSPL